MFDEVCIVLNSLFSKYENIEAEYCKILRIL